MTKIIVQRRPRTYVNMIDGEAVESRGSEIVKEIAVSQAGLKLLKGSRPDLFVEAEVPVERVWRKRPLDEDDEEVI